MGAPNELVPAVPDPAALGAFVADQSAGVPVGPDQNPYAPKPGLAQGSLLGATPGPVTLPGAPVTAPAAAPAAPAEPPQDPLELAKWKAANDSNQMTQKDWMLLAAEDLAAQNARAGAGGGPTHSVKVGETQSATTQRTKVDPRAAAADAAAAGAMDQQKSAVLDAAHAQAQELAAKAEITQRQAAEVAANNAKQADAEAARQERLAKLEAEQTRLAQDVAKEARSIDPDRWLHQSAGRTIGAALAAALGAYGATLAKTPNYALQIINDAIDRDFAGQKLKLQAKQDAQSMQARTIDRTRALFSDQRAADMAARANLMELHKAQVEALGLKYKGTQVEANAQQAVAQLTVEQEKLRSQALHLNDVHESRSTQTSLMTVDASGNPAGSGSGKGVVPLTMGNINQRAAELATKNKPFVKGETPAQIQRRNQTALDQYAAYSNMVNNTLPQLEAAVREASLASWGPIGVNNRLSQAWADTKQIVNTLAGDRGRLQFGANQTDKEFERTVNNILGSSDSADRKIHAIRVLVGLDAGKIRSIYQSLGDDGKQQFLEAAGGNRKQLDQMLAGKPVNNWMDMGRQMGATSHTEE